MGLLCFAAGVLCHSFGSPGFAYRLYFVAAGAWLTAVAVRAINGK